MKELELTPSNRQMIIDNVDYGIQSGGKCVKFATATSKRTLDQNKKCHAMLADISRQIKHYEQTYSVDVWKRLCVAAWLRECNEQALMIPAIDGYGVEVIFEKTSKLGTKKMAGFIEWLYAYGTNSGVIWSRV
jgi:hypothetical protein